jgi:hypothetical protein
MEVHLLFVLFSGKRGVGGGGGSSRSDLQYYIASSVYIYIPLRELRQHLHLPPPPPGVKGFVADLSGDDNATRDLGSGGTDTAGD